MNQPKTALVTGANRGIGLEIGKQLAQQGFNVILASRDAAKGQKAAEKLGLSNVTSMTLDVTNAAHIDNVRQLLEQQKLKLDVLVNNAGISQGIRYSILNEPESLTRETLEVNFWGALKLSQTVIPFMQQQGFGRVVNVSSGHGSFTKIDQQNAGYRLSKTLMNAMTVMLADAVKGDNILVNAMTPGWVKTRLGGLNAERGVEKGAETAVWLCLLSDDGPRGGFFKDKEVFPW